MSEDAEWLEYAWIIHRAECDRWRGPRWVAGTVQPFGRPDGMPPHEWRVSGDVMQALWNAMPPPLGENPKGSEGATPLLFGWPLDVDRDAIPGTLKLKERAG